MHAACLPSPGVITSPAATLDTFLVSFPESPISLFVMPLLYITGNILYMGLDLFNSLIEALLVGQLYI